MALRLGLEKRCASFLGTLPAKAFRQIALRIFDLMREPLGHDTRALAGTPYRRADVGEYRVIYRIEADTVLVILIGKRNDDEVYRQLRRL